MTRRLRFVLFSASIISDFGNPRATTVRALAQALIEMGHDVVHCEERRNRHLLDLLALRGAEPMRAFNRAYPHLAYRQFDVVGGVARRIWFSREIGTADVVIGFAGAEAGALSEIAELKSERTLSFFPDKPGMDTSIRDALFAPAVLTKTGSGNRTGNLVAAYDHSVPGTGGGSRVTAGYFDDPGWEQVTELELESRYSTANQVTLVDADCTGLGYARALLPVALGAKTIIVDVRGEAIETIGAIEPEFDARGRVRAIAGHIEAELVDRYVRTIQ